MTFSPVWTPFECGPFLFEMLFRLRRAVNRWAADGKAANAHKKTPAAVSGSRCFVTLKS
jgi:hypothetical protein